MHSKRAVKHIYIGFYHNQLELNYVDIRYKNVLLQNASSLHSLQVTYLGHMSTSSLRRLPMAIKQFSFPVFLQTYRKFLCPEQSRQRVLSERDITQFQAQPLSNKALQKKRGENALIVSLDFSIGNMRCILETIMKMTVCEIQSH